MPGTAIMQAMNEHMGDGKWPSVSVFVCTHFNWSFVCQFHFNLKMSDTDISVIHLLIWSIIFPTTNATSALWPQWRMLMRFWHYALIIVFIYFISYIMSHIVQIRFHEHCNYIYTLTKLNVERILRCELRDAHKINIERMKENNLRKEYQTYSYMYKNIKTVYLTVAKRQKLCGV